MNRIIHHHGLPKIEAEEDLDTTLQLASETLINEDGDDLNVWASRLRDTWFGDINQMKVEDPRLVDEAVNSVSDEI